MRDTDTPSDARHLGWTDGSISLCFRIPFERPEDSGNYRPTRGTHPYAGTVARRRSGVKNGSANLRGDGRLELTANPDFAEAEQDASAAHGPAKSQLRTEAGEQQNLINLALRSGIA